MDPAALRVTVADGVRLHVRHWPGEPDRTPFLLVHGLSSNARLWDGVATRLAAAGYPAYAVDLRSHGESERPPDGYDDYARAVREEYAHVPEPLFRAGRATVLRHLLGLPELYRIVPERADWTVRAHANLHRELSALDASA